MKSRHFTDLDNMVKSSKTNLRRFASSSLIILFWNIGKRLNIYGDKSPGLNMITIIKQIEKQLKVCYGPYFSQAVLIRMMHFAKLFPNLTYVQVISQFISWDQFVILLKVKKTEALKFYLDLKIEKGWKKSELERAIMENLFEREYKEAVIKAKRSGKKVKSFSTKKQINYTLPVWDVNTLQINDSVKPNIFKQRSYRILLNSEKITFSSLNKDELFKDVVDCIENFKMNQNHWLNQSLNTLFWEIGKFINEAEINKLFWAGIEKELMKHRISFDKRQREAMRMFYHYYRTEDAKNLIINIISWEQILEILKIKDNTERLFYIKLASFEGLDSKKLKKRIKMGEYRNTTNSQLQIADLLRVQVNKRIVVETIATKRDTATFTTVDYEYDLKKVVLPKTHESPYFVRFIL